MVGAQGHESPIERMSTVKYMHQTVEVKSNRELYAALYYMIAEIEGRNYTGMASPNVALIAIRPTRAPIPCSAIIENKNPLVLVFLSAL